MKHPVSIGEGRRACSLDGANHKQDGTVAVWRKKVSLTDAYTLRSTSNALICEAFTAQLWHWEEILKYFYVANCLMFCYLTGRSCP